MNKEKEMKFKCIKGVANEKRIYAMQGDVVKLVEVNDGEVIVMGDAGWCKNECLTFTPIQFAEHFVMWGLTLIM